MNVLLLLIALASPAWAISWTAPFGGQGACPFEGCRTDVNTINVAELPFNAVGDGVTDNAVAIQAALDRQEQTGEIVFFPCGIFRVGTSLLVSEPSTTQGNIFRGTIIEGSGKGCTIIETNTSAESPTGFPLFRSKTHTTCAGGTGDATTCDDRIESATRGPGCICYQNADCQSNVCSGGSSKRQITFRDFAIRLRKDNTIGIDLTGISSSSISNMAFESGTVTNQNTIGIIGNGNILATYYNTIESSDFGRLEICALLLEDANAWSFYGNKFGNDCGSGVVFEGFGSGAIGNQLYGNTFQTTQVGVCGSPCTASTCCGGFFHGQTCATAADCSEADIVDLGVNNSYIGNYFEDSIHPHIRLGCAATAGTFCAVADPVSGATSIGNSHLGTAAFVSKDNLPTQSPLRVADPIDVSTKRPAAFYSGTGDWGQTAPVACATTNPGIRYYDTDLQMSCFCNGQGTPRYCRDDTGACGSTTTDCG
jgi:hypothetical protein